MSLHISIKQFKEAQHVLATSTHFEDLQAAYRAVDSAILGILSSLGYLMVGSMYLYGGAATLALVVGCIATFTNALKIIYDWYYTAPESPFASSKITNEKTKYDVYVNLKF